MLCDFEQNYNFDEKQLQLHNMRIAENNYWKKKHFDKVQILKKTNR